MAIIGAFLPQARALACKAHSRRIRAGATARCAETLRALAGAELLIRALAYGWRCEGSTQSSPSGIACNARACRRRFQEREPLPLKSSSAALKWANVETAAPECPLQLLKRNLGRAPLRSKISGPGPTRQRARPRRRRGAKNKERMARRKCIDGKKPNEWHHAVGRPGTGWQPRGLPVSRPRVPPVYRRAKLPEFKTSACEKARNCRLTPANPRPACQWRFPSWRYYAQPTTGPRVRAGRKPKTESRLTALNIEGRLVRRGQGRARYWFRIPPEAVTRQGAKLSVPRSRHSRPSKMGPPPPNGATQPPPYKMV